MLKFKVRLRGNRGEVKGPPGKLHAQLVNHRGFEHRSKRAGDGLIAVEVVLESGRQVEAVVQWRLVQQSSIVDEIADEHAFLLAEAVIQPQETVVCVICAKNTAQGWFLRQAINSLDFVDEFNVLEDGRIVERRFTAALEFKVAEDKGLVLLDRATDGRTKLVLAQNVRAVRLQEIDGVRLVVAEILIGDSVPLICAAAPNDVHDTGARAPKLDRGVGVGDP